ncbi:MAG: hypothetical protein AAF333_16535 [Planctomycetota bacterium]
MKRRWTWAGAWLLTGLCGAWAVSAAAQELVVIDGRDTENLVTSVHGEGEARSDFRTIGVAGQPFKEAVRARVTRPIDPAWHIQVVTRYSLIPVRRGDLLKGSYYIRGTSKNGSPPEVRLAFSKLVDGYESLLEAPVEVTDEWQRQEFQLVAGKDYDKGVLIVGFHLGSKAQTVEVADFKIVIGVAEPE